mmetsp:Transcript_52674/g.136425  ORF Transcript_52674/g.136425 Transcript_52674/m.136425 type:complete len:487 (+) Transcript_52674:22-1482(+)
MLVLGVAFVGLAFNPHNVVLRGPAVGRHVRAAVRAADGDDARPALSWQEELEKLLSPNTKTADREVLLRDLLSKGPEIAQEVSDAAVAGNIASLLPEDSTSRKTLDDIQFVQRQVIEDVLPEAANEAADPQRLSESLQRAAADVPGAAQTAAQVSSALFADPEKALSLVQQEARNALSRTPEGLEILPFTTIENKASYELRRYDSHSVAMTSVAAVRAVGLEGTIRGFNALTAYLVGSNADGAVLEMTSPLRTDVAEEFGGGDADISVMLPRRLSPMSAPAPADATVRLTTREGQTLAVREFAGLATEAEARRQLLALRQALSADGIMLAAADGAYSVLQYNPPYTLPWLRRNEVAVAVVLDDQLQAAEVAPAAQAEDATKAEANEQEEVAAARDASSSASDATDDMPSDVDDTDAVDDVEESATAEALPLDEADFEEGAEPSDVDEDAVVEMESVEQDVEGSDEEVAEADGDDPAAEDWMDAPSD